MNISLRSALLFISVFFLMLVIVFFTYYSGLFGAFVFDDNANISGNSSIAITSLDVNSLKAAAFSSSSGLLQRPLSMLSFALNYYVTGLDPFYFKLTNLVIHLINGVGIFILTRLLLSVYRARFEPELSVAYLRWVSLAVSAAWLLHPLNLTSVLYVVQRMTSLSALFSIGGLVFFMWGRMRLLEGKNGILPIMAGLLLFLPLAALSKENGVLLPLFLLVIEVTLFSFQAAHVSARRFLFVFYVAFVAVPAIAAVGYMVLHPDWVLAGYSIRNFTLPERLMTEARVLWFYLGQILLPGNAQMGLYHDDIEISRGLFQPVNTLLAIAGVFGLLGGAYAARKKAPILAFGVLFFFAGHLLESTVISLEIAHEHRNYLPMYGILLVLFYYLMYPLKYADTLRLRQVVAVLLIALFAFNTYARANKWSNLYDQFQAEFQHHPNSVMVNVEMGGIYSGLTSNNPNVMEFNYNAAREHYERAVSLDKNDTKALFGLIMLNASRGRFVESGWINELTHRLEFAPYAAITSDRLLDLSRCEFEGACRIAYVEYEGLLQAALRNPSLTGLNRVKVLFALSTYNINVSHDYPAALGLMYQMVAAAPQEVASRIVLINFLIAMQHVNDAQEQLAVLKGMDKAQVRMSEIQEMEQKLSEITNNESRH